MIQAGLLRAGMVLCSVVVRIMGRLRASVLCLLIIVPRTRLRTLVSACAVFDGLQSGGTRGLFCERELT